MKRGWWLLCAPWLFGACGADDGLIAPVAIRVVGLEATGLEIYVFGQLRTDDIMLTCGSLMEQEIEPGDALLREIAHTTAGVTAGATAMTATLPDIPSGNRRLVFVEAYAGATLTGRGCTDLVTITSNATAEVDVVVYPI